MEDEDLRQSATFATQPALSAEDAASMFAEAGVPKTVRTIQRYCRNGILDCIRADAEFGDRYLIDPNSVTRRIDELKKFAQMMASSRAVAPLRDEGRLV